MGLLIECPKCKRRNGLKADVCKCGFNLKKQSGKTYWIEFRDSDKNRKRERIGPNKQAAETRLHGVLKNRAEDRYIDKDKNVRVKFDEVADWYLELAQIKAKKSFRRDQLSVKVLKAFFSGKVVKDVTKSQVEAYRQKRLSDTSYHKHPVRPGTINREIACLKHMFNLAEEEGMIETVPFKKLKTLKENNVRNRLLSNDEYARLLAYSSPHTARIIKMAYYTAMRQGEILNLTWDKVDLKNGVVRLNPEDTKTNEGRTIPLHPEVVKMLKAMPRTIHGRVFTMDGHPLAAIKKSFRGACERAKIENFRFHDLRHTCINNWRLQGHDFFRIMEASGHKTMSVFQRYNHVSDEELQGLVRPPMDTYMDIKNEEELTAFCTTA